MKTIKKTNCVFVTLLSIIGFNAYSQEEVKIPVINPPITTELLFSNRGMAFQMIADKKFKSAPKFGFFNVSYILGEWDNKAINDYMTQSSLTFEVVKGLKLTAGFHVTSVHGVRPIAGLLYTAANKNWLFVANSRVSLSKDVSVEGFVLTEYKPKISKNWCFYSRIQALYEYNTSIGMHDRSYIVARAGFGFKEFYFGAGTNLDFYGPTRHNENSIGGFVSFLLF